jgi:nucleoside-diphosphate-sugar epimerase
MSTILIAGASGQIGRPLATALSPKHEVICFSRNKPDVKCRFVKGSFHSFEDLSKLDDYSIDVLVHLGAVLADCNEENGISVNTSGTRTLLRYLIDRNCRKFVLASSIGATGIAVKEFIPTKLPIPDEHPCLAKDAYGLSKYLMEEVTRYFARIYEDADFINIRLGGVDDDNNPPSPVKPGPVFDWAFAEISRILLSDAVRVFMLAAESLHKPGVRIMNAVGPESVAVDTVPDLMRSWFPDKYWDLDLSHYEKPGHGRDPVFDITTIRNELGFIPKKCT